MRVLIVEDDPGIREGIAEFLSELVDVKVAATLAEAERWLESESFDLVLTDLFLGGQSEDGLAVVRGARKNGAKVAVLTAAAPAEIASTLKPGQADAVLTKPFSLDEIEALLARYQVRASG